MQEVLCWCLGGGGKEGLREEGREKEGRREGKGGGVKKEKRGKWRSGQLRDIKKKRMK